LATGQPMLECIVPSVALWSRGRSVSIGDTAGPILGGGDDNEGSGDDQDNDGDDCNGDDITALTVVGKQIFVSSLYSLVGLPWQVAQN